MNRWEPGAGAGGGAQEDCGDIDEVRPLQNRDVQVAPLASLFVGNRRISTKRDSGPRIYSGREHCSSVSES